MIVGQIFIPISFEQLSFATFFFYYSVTAKNGYEVRLYVVISFCA